MAKSNNKNNSVGGLLFVGCMFIGMAIGFGFNQIAIGTAAGMGVGFLAMAGYIAMNNKKS